MNHPSTKILCIDDDSDDCIFLSESLAANDSGAALVCAHGAEEAIHYLATADELPALIVLDLNMPKWDGKKTLAYLKSHPGFSSIPVVILSTSENSADREICSRLGAISYMKKPFHFSEYRSIIQSFMPFLRTEQA
ncbi:MAG TPA: response regulator [Flavisolibacter sp.]